MDTHPAGLVKYILKWLKKHFARTYSDRAITILWLVTVMYTILPFLWWSLINAVWFGSLKACGSQGACWLYVAYNLENLLYGPLPRYGLWRMNTVVICMTLSLVLLVYARRKMMALLVFCMIPPLSVIYILHGGSFGLSLIPEQYWGGFSLNIVLSLLSIALAFPLSIGILLARVSSMWLVQASAKCLIAVSIGIPLVVHLFNAKLFLPLFFPVEWVPGKFVRIVATLSIFGACYIAEVLRGGLQSIPKQQFEACESLGLSYTQQMMFVILPQAIQAVFPGLVNLVIALFKDSVLISTIAMMDVLAMMQSTLANTVWMPYFIEGYLFVGGLFWVICFGLSQVSKDIEEKIQIRR